ncbi:MAG: hypothetical protein ABW023_04270 [Sphingomonas sp.]
MRGLLWIAPVALMVAGCNAADRTADQLDNAAGTAGNAIASGAGEVASTASNAGEALGNGIEDAGNIVSGAVTRDAWVGRWKGVEGTYLVVSKGDAPGRYRLEMQYTLDSKGKYDGTATPSGIAFERPDGSQVLRASSGDATGLKYLAGKKDCLKVKDGEGYCRD